MKKKKVYLYDKCGRCGNKKDKTKQVYCKTCNTIYHIQYRQNRLSPNINLKGLKDFIDKVNKQDGWVTDQDMLSIMFFYEIITVNIKEFDDLPTQHQYYYMWHAILDYYKIQTTDKNI